MRVRTLFLLVPAALLIWGCRGDVLSSADPGAEYGIFFPRYSLAPDQPRPVSGLRGLLALRDGCIWVEPAHGREVFLALWPNGSVPRKAGDQLEILDPSGRRFGAIEEQVGVSGGEIRDEAYVKQLTGRETPEACRGHPAWLVTGLLTSN